MLRRAIFSVSSALLMGMLGAPALATEGAPPLLWPPVMPAFDVEAGTMPPGAVAEIASSTSLAQEIAARLARSDGRLTISDREDREALAKFYAARGHEPEWITDTGFTASAQVAIAEIGQADDWGLDSSAFRLPSFPASGGSELSRDQRADAEITLGLAVLKYARHARGGRTDPTSLSQNMDRKPPLLDPSSVIDGIAKAADAAAYLRGLHPQHPQFALLRQKYLAVKKGQPIALASDDSGKSKRKQNAASTLDNPSLRKLLVNMEQWRWMPSQLGSYYIWVNIPEYTLRVVKNAKTIHSERVVAGKPATQTPIFSDAMEQVIFHPFWGVPDSIKQNELLPSLARGNTGILERQNLRVKYRGRDIDPQSVDWATVDMRKLHVYQPPGRGNALGVVKFRFPNKHDVYMHDTPSKSLFNASVRAYSHGCMRVRDPQKLAELLLAEDKAWPASRVAAAIKNGPDDYQVNLTQKFPVHITYFTAWVDADGHLKQYADIYGHESRIALGIDGKAHMIARAKEDKPPARAARRGEPIARVAETESVAPSPRREWTRQIWGN